jgi:hypothetical protein
VGGGAVTEISHDRPPLVTWSGVPVSVGLFCFCFCFLGKLSQQVGAALVVLLVIGG